MHISKPVGKDFLENFLKGLGNDQGFILECAGDDGLQKISGKFISYRLEGNNLRIKFVTNEGVSLGRIIDLSLIIDVALLSDRQDEISADVCLDLKSPFQPDVVPDQLFDVDPATSVHNRALVNDRESSVATLLAGEIGLISPAQVVLAKNQIAKNMVMAGFDCQNDKI